MPQNKDRKTIAVVGAGVAGIVAAHYLSNKYDVTLFERNHYLGGHTNTVTIQSGPDEGTAIDAGFAVLNDREYPLLHKFLRELNVPTRSASMSFSFHCERSRLTYGSSGLGALFAQRENIISLSFLRFLGEFPKFWRCASAALNSGYAHDLTLSQFCAESDLLSSFCENYLYPVSAAIWSSPRQDIRLFPAYGVLNFFKTHGLIGLKSQPQWQTIEGGAHRYVKAFRDNFSGAIHTSSPIKAISRSNGQFTTILEDSSHKCFDYGVIASHADEALKLLTDPTSEEASLLGQWQYRPNEAVLHTDISFLPPTKRAWSSWNYRRELGESGSEPISITYNMNILQGLQTKETYLVTLNPRRQPPASRTISTFLYSHPLLSNAAAATQCRLGALGNEFNTWYCGSYFGGGFHEDAVRSACDVARKLGCECE